MEELLKQVIIDVLAEKVQELEWELHSKNEIIEDLEKQIIMYSTTEVIEC